MKTPTYTIEITDRERVCAYPDMSSYTLEDIIGEEYGVVVLDGPRSMSHTYLSYGNTHHMEDAIRGLADNFYRGSSTGWWDRRNRAIHLYLNLSGFDSVIHTLQGYSQGEWCEIVLFRKRDVDWHITDYNIVNTIPYVNAWFAGDIYSVTHEKLVTYVNPEDTEDTIDRWNEIDAIHCQMILDTKDFVDIAKIEFDIPKLPYQVKIG